MDKFSAMQAYVRVVEAGTFTKAADSMGLPKPTVTRLIQTLEKHLQTKLLNRTTRRVTVTADGAAYYDRALRILGEMDELESSMSHAKANPRVMTLALGGFGPGPDASQLEPWTISEPLRSRWWMTSPHKPGPRYSVWVGRVAVNSLRK